MARLPDAQLMIDAIEDPALVVEAGKVVLFNAAATRLMGRISRGSDLRLVIRNPIALDHIHSGRPAEVEVVGIDRPGRPWLVSLREAGTGMLLVRLIDLSAARAAEKMRVDFVANASHELRTPLATILGYAETLSDGDLDAETNRKFGSIISSEAQRMVRIVDDLISLSRIEADRFVEPSEQVGVADIVRIAAGNARRAADSRRCSVETEIEPNLPDIPGDPTQLVQLFDNLIGNALRYGCKEQGSVVLVTVRREGERIVFRVIDEGDGIPREHLPRLTERFYRVDEARSRETGGTGLGLAIVKHIVERHRGTLDIDSTVGKGTQVTVRLPIG